MASNPDFIKEIDEVLSDNDTLQHEVIETLGDEGAPVLDEMLQKIGATLAHGKIVRKD